MGLFRPAEIMILVHVSQDGHMREMREAIKSIGRRRDSKACYSESREPDRLSVKAAGSTHGHATTDRDLHWS